MVIRTNTVQVWGLGFCIQIVVAVTQIYKCDKIS